MTEQSLLTGSEKPALNSNATTIANLLFKYFAAFIAFVYIFGYVISFLHDGSYGFRVMSPFHAHILSAGLLYFIFMLYPFAIYFVVILASWNTSTQKYDEPSGIFFMLSSAYLPFTFLLKDLFIIQTVKYEYDYLWILLTIALYLLYYILKNKYKAISVISLILAWLIYISGFIYILYYTFTSHIFTIYNIHAWTYSIFLGILFTHYQLKKTHTQVPYAFFAIFILSLTGFARNYYPFIKSIWGGGELSNIELVLSKSSTILPGNHINCQLIDEDDKGLYIKLNYETNATYIPRDNIALIRYVPQIYK